MFKQVFKRCFVNQKLNYPEFSTMVAECEMIINDRPLTFPYADLHEGEPITPSQLLNGYTLTALPPLSKDLTPEEELNISSCRVRAKYLEALRQRFWRSWYY